MRLASARACSPFSAVSLRTRQRACEGGYGRNRSPDGRRNEICRSSAHAVARLPVAVSPRRTVALLVGGGCLTASSTRKVRSTTSCRLLAGRPSAAPRRRRAHGPLDAAAADDGREIDHEMLSCRSRCGHSATFVRCLIWTRARCVVDEASATGKTSSSRDCALDGPRSFSGGQPEDGVRLAPAVLRHRCGRRWSSRSA